MKIVIYPSVEKVNDLVVMRMRIDSRWTGPAAVVAAVRVVVADTQRHAARYERALWHYVPSKHIC